MMYPHFVFTHSTRAQIEFSVIDLVCCSNDDIGNESETRNGRRGDKELQMQEINFWSAARQRNYSFWLNENIFSANIPWNNSLAIVEIN